MRGLRWAVVALVALVVSCGGHEPSEPIDHVLPIGPYSYNIVPKGWGSAISLPNGMVIVSQATPDSLVTYWGVGGETPLIARFINGAYQVKVVGHPWTIDYRLWRDGVDVYCTGVVSPEITNPTTCDLMRIVAPEEPR